MKKTVVLACLALLQVLSGCNFKVLPVTDPQSFSEKIFTQTSGFTLLHKASKINYNQDIGVKFFEFEAKNHDLIQTACVGKKFDDLGKSNIVYESNVGVSPPNWWRLGIFKGERSAHRLRVPYEEDDALNYDIFMYSKLGSCRIFVLEIEY